METQLIVWIALAAGFAVLELATMAFVAMYFALGSIAAALVAWGDGSLTWQIAAFVLASVVLMLATRPFFKKRLESPDVPTNVYQVIGKSGIITIPIDNHANTGQIRIGTEFWTARLSDSAGADDVVGVDEKVRVLAVEGVTARVERLTS